MREILFRGKTESGCWTRGSLSLYSEPGKVEILYPVNFEDEDGNITPSFDYVEVIPETVGQFTGLLDKDGKKIFEGDVIKLDSNLNTERKNFEVKFAYGQFYIGINRPVAYVRYSCEIIGNIHDNPELLEE